MHAGEPRIDDIGSVRRAPSNPRWRINGVVSADWHVLAVVHGGLAQYEVDGERLLLRRGDILLLRPGMQRSGHADARAPWDFTVCSFRLAGTLRAPLRLAGGARSPALRLADELLAAWRSATRGRRFLALARLHELLALLVAGGDAAQDGRIRDVLAGLLALPPARLPSAETTARGCGLSTSRFRELFRESTGMAFHHWQLVRRLELARSALLSGEADIATAAARSGFTDTRYFSRLFHRHLGTTPSACLPR